MFTTETRGKLRPFRRRRGSGAWSLSKVAWTVIQFEALLPHLRINDFDRDLPVGAVAGLVRGRISNQILLPQVPFNLRKGILKIALVPWKICPSAGGVGNFS